MAVIESYIDEIVDIPEDIKKMTREQLKAEIERLEMGNCQNHRYWYRTGLLQQRLDLVIRLFREKERRFVGTDRLEPVFRANL